MLRTDQRPSPAPFLALAVLVALSWLSAAACGGGEEPEEAAGEPIRIEDEELGLAVVIPPGSPFEPAESEPGEIRLRFPGGGEFTPGTVVFRAEPAQYFGVNLVDAVNERKEEVESRPGGDFLGQMELGSHLGTAFSTRARFDDESGEQVEEVRVYAVHPSGDRLLHMTYRYTPTPGQTEARMREQAFEAFGYAEGLVSEGATAESEETEAAAGPEAEEPAAGEGEEEEEEGPEETP